MNKHALNATQTKQITPHRTFFLCQVKLPEQQPFSKSMKWLFSTTPLQQPLKIRNGIRTYSWPESSSIWKHPSTFARVCSQCIRTSDTQDCSIHLTLHTTCELMNQQSSERCVCVCVGVCVCWIGTGTGTGPGTGTGTETGTGGDAFCVAISFTSGCVCDGLGSGPEATSERRQRIFRKRRQVYSHSQLNHFQPNKILMLVCACLCFFLFPLQDGGKTFRFNITCPQIPGSQFACWGTCVMSLHRQSIYI